MYSSALSVPEVPSSSDDSVFALNTVPGFTGPTTAVDWVLRCSGNSSSGFPGTYSGPMKCSSSKGLSPCLVLHRCDSSSK
jgi:hypothetical protein